MGWTKTYQSRHRSSSEDHTETERWFNTFKLTGQRKHIHRLQQRITIQSDCFMSWQFAGLVISLDTIILFDKGYYSILWFLSWPQWCDMDTVSINLPYHITSAFGGPHVFRIEILDQWHIWIFSIGWYGDFLLDTPSVIKYILTNVFLTAENDYDSPECF